MSYYDDVGYWIDIHRSLSKNNLNKKSSPSLKLWRANVESGRLELPSKQAIKQFSTRLVFTWVFVLMLAKNNLHQPYSQSISLVHQDPTQAIFTLPVPLM